MKSKRKKNETCKRPRGVKSSNVKGRKISKSRRSIKKEKKFVSSFLQQPARTRSGIRYSKRSRGSESSSNESIFGSISAQYTEEYNRKLRSVKSTSHICQCKQCYEKCRNKKLNTNLSCESSHKGLSIFLNDENKACKRRNAPSHPNASSGIRVHNSSPELKMTSRKKSGTKKQTTSSKNTKKRQGKDKKAKQQPKTKAKRESSTKKKSENKKTRERPRAKSSSLLKFILKKASGAPESDSALKPHHFGGKNDCACCARYQRLLQEFSKNMMLVKISPKLKKLPARYNLLRLWKPCLQPLSASEYDSSASEDTPLTSCRTRSRSVAPMPRAAAKSPASSDGKIQSQNKWKPLSKIVKNIRERRGNDCMENCTSALSRTVAPIPSCGIAKRVSDVVVSKRSGTARNKYPHSALMPSSGPIKKRKPKKKKRKSATKPKSKKTKRSATQKTSKKQKIDKWKAIASRKYQKNEDLRQVLNQITNKALSAAKTPMPSSRVPTFIAMVKTAIRDLEKFHMTSREALSK